jgi:hypothetical protein
MHSFGYGGSYGLGVAKNDQKCEKAVVRTFNHDGGGFGFGATYNYCPQAQIAWIVLFNGTTLAGNTTSPQSAFRAAIALQMEKRVFARFGKQLPPSDADLPEIEMSAQDLRRFVGNYIGRGSEFDILLQNGSLQIRRGARINRLSFSSPDQAWFAEGSQSPVRLLRYHPARGLEAAHFELINDGPHFDFNYGPDDATGPVGTELDHLLGGYQIDTWGKPAKKVLAKKNGYLCLDNLRLAQHIPGLFFTGDGEAVDFRSDNPTFRNIRLKRLLTWS